MSSLRSYVQVFAFDLLCKALLAGTTILLIRYMAPDDFAAYTFALSTSAIVAQTVSSSINRVYIVGVDGAAADAGAATFLGAQLWGGALLVLLVLPLRAYANGLFEFIVALSYGSILSEFAKTYYQRELKFFRLSIVEFVRAAAFSGAVVGLIVTMRLRSWTVLAGQTAAMLLVSVAVFRRVRFAEIVDVRRAMRLLRAIVRGDSRFVSGYFVLVALFPQVPILALQVLRPGDLATFGSAFRYYSLLLMALNTAHVVLLPSLQKATSGDEMNAVFQRHRHLVVLFAVVVGFGALVARWIIPWVDHGKYPGAVGVFRLLAVSAVISFALSPHVNVLLTTRRFRYIFWLMTVGTAFSVIITPILVGTWGALGAASSVLIVGALINAFVYRESVYARARLENAYVV